MLIKSSRPLVLIVQLALLVPMALITALVFAAQAEARVCLRNPAPFAPATLSETVTALQTNVGTRALQTDHAALQATVTTLQNQLAAREPTAWLAAWRAHGSFNAGGGGTGLGQSMAQAYTQHSPGGHWSVTAGAGAVAGRQTVSGISLCTADVSGGNPGWNISHGNNCWCQMTAPLVGQSWVFVLTLTNANSCAHVCAQRCARCIWNGSQDSCTRAALLALP